MRPGTVLKVAVGAAGTAYGAVQLANAAIRRREDVDPDAIERPGAIFYVRGVGTHFIDQGHGPVVLLLHGFGGSTFSFRHQIGPLATHHRVLALDLPGFGLSDRPLDADLSLTAHAERLREMLDRLGIETASIVGASMGGIVGMRLAAAHPERVERLVLAGSPAPDRQIVRPRYTPARPFLPVGYTLLWGRPAYLQRTLRRVVYDPAFVTDDICAGYAYPWRIRGTAAALFRFARDARRDLPVHPAGIGTRTLLLWGEADPAVPLSVAHRLHATLPDARLEVLPRAGHLVLEEQPEACTASILRFLGAPVNAAVAAAP
jgi:pimeloyl-ACP methyl ester carboxylesterase